MSKMLVVGGDGVFVQNVLGPKLKEVGIEVGWIWDRQTNPQYTVPTGCEGILILKSAIGHTMADRASAMARDAGVPWARVEHRFSKALPILRAVGMVEPKSNGVGKEPPSTQDKYEVARSYLQQEFDMGRTPSRGEIRGVIKRAFGPHVSISDKLVAKARGVAASRSQAFNPGSESKGDKMSTAAAAPEQAHDWGQLSEWLVLIIEEHPEGSHEEWVRRLRELTVGDLPPDDDLMRLTENVYQEQRAVWDTHHRTWPKDKRAAVMAMRRGWMKRFMLTYQEEHGKLPSYETVKAASKDVFPKSVHGWMIREVRHEILGVDSPVPTPEPKPESLPPKPGEPGEESPGELRRKGRYTAARITKAVRVVKAWHKRLTPPQAAALHGWVNRIMRNPRKARTPSDVKDLFVDFRRKPLEFAGAFLLVVPKGKTVSQGMIRAAYKKIMQVTMGPYVIELMAEALGLTKQVTRVMDPPTSPEPVDGFFNSLNDAYHYFLGRAEGRISMGAFRKLLADGQIEGHKESTTTYAPWIINAASVDRCLAQYSSREAPEPPEGVTPPQDTAEVEALRAELEQVTRERDELRAAPYAYATEFPDKNGEPDVGSVHKNIHKLKDQAERNSNLRDQWKTKAEEARSKVSTLEHNLWLAEAKVRGAVEMAKQVQTLATQVDTLRTEREAAFKEAARLRAKVSSLREQVAALKWEALGAIEELDDGPSGELDDGPSGSAKSTEPPAPEAAAPKVSTDLIQQVLDAGCRLVIEPVT